MRSSENTVVIFVESEAVFFKENHRGIVLLPKQMYARSTSFFSIEFVVMWESRNLWSIFCVSVLASKGENSRNLLGEIASFNIFNIQSFISDINWLVR